MAHDQTPSEKRHLLLVLNGKAAPREDVRSAVEAVRGAGHTLEVRVTYDGDDAGRFVREAVEREDARPGVIVAGGGDGTINQVIASALETRPETDCAFGALPLGTANDFATGMGLPVDDVRAAGRATQGVTIFRTAPDERVVSVERVEETGENGSEEE